METTPPTSPRKDGGRAPGAPGPVHGVTTENPNPRGYRRGQLSDLLEKIDRLLKGVAEQSYIVPNVPRATVYVFIVLDRPVSHYRPIWEHDNRYRLNIGQGQCCVVRAHTAQDTRCWTMGIMPAHASRLLNHNSWDVVHTSTISFNTPMAFYDIGLSVDCLFLILRFESTLIFQLFKPR